MTTAASGFPIHTADAPSATLCSSPPPAPRDVARGARAGPLRRGLLRRARRSASFPLFVVLFLTALLSLGGREAAAGPSQLLAARAAAVLLRHGVRAHQPVPHDAQRARLGLPAAPGDALLGGRARGAARAVELPAHRARHVLPRRAPAARVVHRRWTCPRRASRCRSGCPCCAAACSPCPCCSSSPRCSSRRTRSSRTRWRGAVLQAGPDVRGHGLAGVLRCRGGFASLGLLAHALRRRRQGTEAGGGGGDPGRGAPGLHRGLTLVGLVDLLFLGFAAIQLAFLFGEAHLPEGSPIPSTPGAASSSCSRCR